MELWRKSVISRELEKLLSSQEPTETKRKRINPEGQGFKSNEKNAFQQQSGSNARPRPPLQEPDYSNTGWSDRVPDVMTQTDFRTPPNMSAIDVSIYLRTYPI